MFGGGGGRKEGGEPRPDEENRACEECLWEGGRLGKSTAEMHSFVPRIEGRGGVGGGEHERLRHSGVFNHDGPRYISCRGSSKNHANKTY